MGILDRYTRIDEILDSILAHIKQSEQANINKDLKVIYFTYPDDGTLATLQAGTTILDFKSGTIIDTNGNATPMSHSLDSEGKLWLRSFFLSSDKFVTISPDDGDKIPVEKEKYAIGTYQEFTKLTITCTEENEVFVLCSTSPDAGVKLVSNSMVLSDPKDTFGNRVYIGAAELAARLGSIDTFERQGNLVWMDDFESSTVKWTTSGSGTGHAEARSVESAKNKTYSFKLTTGNAKGNYALMYKQTYLPKTSRIGCEFSFALGASIWWIEQMIDFYTGAEKLQSILKYFPQANGLMLYVPGDTPTIATGLDLKESDLLYHTLKLVVDLYTKKFVRLFLDYVEYDLSVYDLVETMSSTTPRMVHNIFAYNNATGNHYVYIDDFILTQNEPL